MTFSNDNKNTLTFRVNDLKQATAWYSQQSEYSPVSYDDTQAIFDMGDSYLVLISQSDANICTTSPACFSKKHFGECTTLTA